MAEDGLTREEKETLVQKVTEVAFRGLFNRTEMAAILKICAVAVNRRIAEIDALTKPDCDIVQ